MKGLESSIVTFHSAMIAVLVEGVPQNHNPVGRISAGAVKRRPSPVQRELVALGANRYTLSNDGDLCQLTWPPGSTHGIQVVLL